MKASEPKQLGVALAAVLHDLGLGKKMKQVKALEIWKQVVGERIAKVTSPERIDGGKLVIRVSKAPWRNELVFLKKEIIAKLNAVLGEGVVQDIHFR